jgi:hypothetical protein
MRWRRRKWCLHLVVNFGNFLQLHVQSPRLRQCLRHSQRLGKTLYLTQPDETRVATALLLHLTHELKCVMGQEVEELAGILTASIYSEVAVLKSFEPFGLSDLPVSAPLLRRPRRGEEKECQDGVGEGERSWLDGNPLIEQLPYYDVNLRCEKQYLQGRSELAEGKQHALQDKTEILALRARVFELEQSRIGFDKEMGRIAERSEKLHRDNIRWFDLYKEASSSAGGVMVELQALRRERKVLLTENALQVEAKYQEGEVSEVQQPSASASARVASAATSQDASCASSVVTSRAGSPLGEGSCAGSPLTRVLDDTLRYLQSTKDNFTFAKSMTFNDTGLSVRFH